jgi:hypothetical protein
VVRKRRYATKSDHGPIAARARRPEPSATA